MYCISKPLSKEKTYQGVEGPLMVTAITDPDGPTLAVTVGLLEPIMAGGPPFKQ